MPTKIRFVGIFFAPLKTKTIKKFNNFDIAKQ